MDRGLVERAQRGDADAFETIVRSRLESVYLAALGVLRSPDEARDATQQTFVHAWRQLPQLRDTARFDPWLTKIALNASRDMLRHRKRLREIPVDGAGALEAPDESPDERLALATAIESLSADARRVIGWHYLADRPVTEIASRLGISTGTVKSRLFNARRALREALGKEQDR